MYGLITFKMAKRDYKSFLKESYFKLSREVQIFLQSRDVEEEEEEDWRPFIICVSKDSFKRKASFDLLRWLSHKYGFGTYIHFIDGFLSKQTYEESRKVMHRLLAQNEGLKSKSLYRYNYQSILYICNSSGNTVIRSKWEGE